MKSVRLQYKWARQRWERSQSASSRREPDGCLSIL